MASDELFRQNSGNESEKIVVDPLSGHSELPKGSRNMTAVDHIRDRLVRVSKGDNAFGEANLAKSRSARKRTSADLKAELAAVSALTIVSWNLKPWRPSTLSRDLLVRIQDSGSSVEKALQAAKNVSERVAVLCGEVNQVNADEESLDI